MNTEYSQAEQLQSLMTVGTVSYILHLIVAIAALVPGAQLGPVLLIVALVIDLIKREGGFDRGDAVEPCQFLFDELLIGHQVGHNNAQEIIARACHQIAFDDLLPQPNGPGKAFEILFFLALELD